jgi:hypothetical protein
MYVAYQVVTVLAVAVAMALALAHALEWPGKLRLTKDRYLAVQQIYYPGFTIGAAAEPLGLLFLFGLLFAMPAGSNSFWLAVGALVLLAAMHASYWLLTHPVNRFWLKGVELKGAGATFFDVGSSRIDAREPDWTQLRNRWEFSHLLRAGFAAASLILLVTAIAIE